MDLDHEFFRVLEYSVRPESGGAGRHRGGVGFCRRYLITRGQRDPGDLRRSVRLRASGTLRRPARRSCRPVRPPQGQANPDRSKQSFALEQGDVLVMLTGGGPAAVIYSSALAT